MDKDFTHVFLPKQEIASEEEVGEMLKEYGITRANLPKIGLEDPAAKAIGAAEGQVVRSVRRTASGGKENYYRLVVSVVG